MAGITPSFLIPAERKDDIQAVKKEELRRPTLLYIGVLKVQQIRNTLQ